MEAMEGEAIREELMEELTATLECKYVMYNIQGRYLGDNVYF